MTPEEIIKDIKLLVSLPDAVIRANQLIDSPSANVAEIGEVISHDPALSAQLLKLVNSSFYSFPSRIDTISRAITMIGLKELRSLIFASATAQAVNRLNSENIDMDSYWQRSVYCGLVAKKLAILLQEKSAESLFLTGLLHDVGRLILFAKLPEQALQAQRSAAATGRQLAEVETELLGFNSAELGAALLESWNLPNNMWEPVRDQRQVEKAGQFATETAILNLALQITDCVEPELKAADRLDLSSLPAATIKGVEFKTEQLELLAADADLESFEVLTIVNPNATLVF
jgi:HD-like signal output (HDOD) protein